MHSRQSLSSRASNITAVKKKVEPPFCWHEIEIFFSSFSEAWSKGATVENAQAGFRTTEMSPLNITPITSEVFSPSFTAESDLLETTDAFPHDLLCMEGGGHN